jgi:hypothetical protein
VDAGARGRRRHPGNNGFCVAVWCRSVTSATARNRATACRRAPQDLLRRRRANDHHLLLTCQPRLERSPVSRSYAPTKPFVGWALIREGTTDGTKEGGEGEARSPKKDDAPHPRALVAANHRGRSPSPRRRRWTSGGNTARSPRSRSRGLHSVRAAQLAAQNFPGLAASDGGAHPSPVVVQAQLSTNQGRAAPVVRRGDRPRRRRQANRRVAGGDHRRGAPQEGSSTPHQRWRDQSSLGRL